MESLCESQIPSLSQSHLRILNLLGTKVHSRFIEFDPLGATKDMRIKIRQMLVEELDRISHELSAPIAENWPLNWREKLHQLENRPYLPNVSISISHCPLVGGFIFSMDQHVSLGLDIEKVSRVNRVIEYVSSQEEIKQMPMKPLLWVAKEAVFKSVPPLPSLISEEQETGRTKNHYLSDSFIFDWKKSGDNSYHFQFHVKKKGACGRGIAFLTGDIAVGYALSQI